jgi:DNA-binding MarR family transcriptional regulator
VDADRSVQEVAEACTEVQVQDLGWALGTMLRAYIKASDAAMAEIPGGPRGYQVLTIADTGACRNQARLAEQVGMDRTMMTYLIDDLERHDLVQRRPDPADRRSRQVLITEPGSKLLRTTRENMVRVEDHILAGLPADEARMLRELLTRAATAMPSLSVAEACTVAEGLTANP